MVCPAKKIFWGKLECTAEAQVMAAAASEVPVHPTATDSSDLPVLLLAHTICSQSHSQTAYKQSKTRVLLTGQTNLICSEIAKAELTTRETIQLELCSFI